MKELFTLLFHFRLKELFFAPTENGLIKFFRYCFVGGIAFLCDYGIAALVFLSLGKGTLSTVAGTTAGFIVGLIVNFLLSKKFVFTEDAATGSKKSEFAVYAAIGLVGLGISNLLMLAATEWVFSISQFIAGRQHPLCPHMSNSISTGFPASRAKSLNSISLSFFLSLSLHTHTHSLTHTHTHTLSLSHTPTHTHISCVVSLEDPD